MAMNIKNERAEQLTRELAARTGQSLTDAIITAVQEKLDRIATDADLKPSERARPHLEKIWAALAASPEPRPSLQEMMDELYDPETGLPA